MALGNPKVDYFSLDIEGAEHAVLSTIDFKKVDISIMSIEVNHAGDIFEGTRQDIINLLSNGYSTVPKNGLVCIRLFIFPLYTLLLKTYSYSVHHYLFSSFLAIFHQKSEMFGYFSPKFQNFCPFSANFGHLFQFT